MHQSPVSKAVAGSTPVLPAQDWELLVTEGHVLGHRVRRAGALFFVPSLAAFAAFLYLVLPVAFGVAKASFLSSSRPVFRHDARVLPTWVYSSLMADPTTYTDLGGGARMGWQMRWLMSLPRQPGMTLDAYGALVAAVKGDLAAFGRDKERWTATPSLKPLVTKADRFVAHASDLGEGLVVFPVDPKDLSHPVLVAAYVGGQFAVNVVGPGGCSAMTGPVVPPCYGGAVNGPAAQAVIDTMKPGK